MDMPESRWRRFGQASVMVGAAVMIVGILLLFDQTEWWGVHLSVPIWPWLLIALGLARLNTPRRWMPGRGIGTWLVIVGIGALLNDARVLGVADARAWPLLVLSAGVAWVWFALRSAPATRSCALARREP
jgi:hypothetical protein